MKNDPDAALDSVVEILRHALGGRFAPDDPNKLPNVILLAWHGMEKAHHALCNYATWLTEQAKPLPHGLQLYVNLRASEGFKPNRKRFGNFQRDLAIAIAVRELVEAGYSSTRNAATEEPSACSLVRRALERLGVNMTERNVEQIWQRRGKGLLNPFDSPR